MRGPPTGTWHRGPVRFDVTQRLAGSCAAVIGVYTDPGFYPRLHSLKKIGQPEVVGRTDAGDRVTMRVRYRFVGDLPGAALAIIDRQKLTWVEETVYDRSTYRSATRLVPDHYSDRLTASATATYTPDPDDPGWCVRRVIGDVKVRIAFVGGKVEGAIVEGFEEHLADEEHEVNAYLAARDDGAVQ